MKNVRTYGRKTSHQLIGMHGKHFSPSPQRKIIFKSAIVKGTFRKKKVVNTGDFVKLYEIISRAEVVEKWDQKRFRVSRA